MRIGIDVGGTNTDAVIMNGNDVLAATKSPTSQDVSSGIVNAMQTVLADANVAVTQIEAVMIGTTHFTNAFVERKQLLKVAVIRLAFPACQGVPPMSDWPEDLMQVVHGKTYLAKGGYEYNGHEISALNEDEIIEISKDIKQQGFTAVAISSVFAPVNDEMEQRTAEIVHKYNPDISITLSSGIGRIGLLERENVAIMNASLSALSVEVVNSFELAIKSLKINAPFFISQNDGTLMNADTVAKYPVLTFASGPTNSMRGAAFLSGLKDAVVIDIGGTTSDLGALVNGFPRESAVNVDIGGVRTNFRMPDILAVGLGGGSLVRPQNNGTTVKIGPDSVGYKLLQEGLVFGGSTLTTTDMVVAAGLEQIGDTNAVADLDKPLIKAAIDEMHNMLEDALDRMKTSNADVPVILVGGGSILINRKIKGASEIVKPEHASVANAIGAAIAQASGEVDRIYCYEELGREQAIEKAKQAAIKMATEIGAEPNSIEIIDIEEVPLAYMPGGSVRLRVKAVGNMQTS